MAAGGRICRPWSPVYLNASSNLRPRACGDEAPGRWGGRALPGPLARLFRAEARRDNHDNQRGPS
ncbi:hypothetical protein BD830_103270 [Maritimibacter alkaliphilus HTCC2654]|nr:hypothetical protein BD830_103270 [Maritimibacter alkaliphilus HTCC2654]